MASGWSTKAEGVDSPSSQNAANNDHHAFPTCTPTTPTGRCKREKEHFTAGRALILLYLFSCTLLAIHVPFPSHWSSGTPSLATMQLDLLDPQKRELLEARLMGKGAFSSCDSNLSNASVGSTEEVRRARKREHVLDTSRTQRSLYMHFWLHCNHLSCGWVGHIP